MNKTIMALLSMMVLFPVVFAGVSGTSLPAAPSFQITSNMTGLCKGRVDYIPIKVTNNGGMLGDPAMQDITLQFSPPRGITSFSNGTATSMPTITAFNSSTIYLPVLVSTNASSVVTLGVNINYYFWNLQYSDSETRNLTFSTYQCATPLSMQVYPRIITNTGAQNLTFNLTNNGKTSLKSVSVGVSISGRQGIAILGNPPQPVNLILPNHTANVKQQIYVSLQNISQMIPVNVSVTFYNGSNLNQLLDNTFLLFGGIINMTPTSVTISPTSISSGSTFSISFVLTNTGTSAASSVTATALAPAGFAHYGTSPTFVGSVAADSQTPVTLSLIAGSNVTTGTYEIPVKITYLDELRNSLTTWVNVSANVQGTATTAVVGGGGAVAVGAAGTANAANANAMRAEYRRAGYGPGDFLNLIIYAIVAVIVVVVAFLFIRRRSKRKQKQREKEKK
jgi:hypothetical protein